MPPPPRTRRVAILGYPAVGKSSLVNQYSDKKFSDEYNTTIANTVTVKRKLCGREYEVQLYDTMGVAELPSFEDTYLTMDGWVLVYSVTNRRSFTVVEEIYDKLNLTLGANTPIVLVGNKTDLNGQREVKEKEGVTMAESMQATFLEASAKEDSGVKEIFEAIIMEIERSRGDPLPKVKDKGDCTIL